MKFAILGSGRWRVLRRAARAGRPRRDVQLLAVRTSRRSASVASRSGVPRSALPSEGPRGRGHVARWSVDLVLFCGQDLRQRHRALRCFGRCSDDDTVVLTVQRR